MHTPQVDTSLCVEQATGDPSHRSATQARPLARGRDPRDWERETSGGCVRGCQLRARAPREGATTRGELNKLNVKL